MQKIENFDIRVYERKLRNGEITQQDYENFLLSVKECDENDFVEIEEETLLKNAGIKRNIEKKSDERGFENE